MFKIIRRFVYYQKVLVYGFNAQDYNEEFRAKTPVWIGPASSDDIKELYQNNDIDLNELPWEFLKEKIASNTWEIIAAKSEGKCVGYASYSTNEMSFSGTKRIEFELPPNTVYIFRDFVLPQLRNLSIGKHLGDFRMKKLKKDGVSVVFAVVNSTNKIQIHNYGKLGGFFIGSVTFVKTKFFNKIFISKSIMKAGLKVKRILKDPAYSSIDGQI
jgi:ribosomal protein S18 acetylase RimI-like enzyme